MGFRSCRFRFSISASSRDSVSVTSRMMEGIFLRPAFLLARQRRSPTISSYPFAFFWTTIGCSTPCSRIERSSSLNFSSSKCCLGCKRFGTISSIRRVDAPLDVSSEGTPSSKSGIKASIPLPNACRFMQRSRFDVVQL